MHRLVVAGRRQPASREDPGDGDDQDQSTFEAVPGDVPQQALDPRPYEVAKTDEDSHPQSAGRDHPDREPSEVEADGSSHQGGIDAKAGKQARSRYLCGVGCPEPTGGAVIGTPHMEAVSKRTDTWR